MPVSDTALAIQHFEQCAYAHTGAWYHRRGGHEHLLGSPIRVEPRARRARFRLGEDLSDYRRSAPARAARSPALRRPLWSRG